MAGVKKCYCFLKFFLIIFTNHDEDTARGIKERVFIVKILQCKEVLECIK